ncbi:MAG: hypothetical protein JWN86_1583 [Planctomycetota bacterium]|nr:hypothetical protein [Planctomycetota bacterium]
MGIHSKRKRGGNLPLRVESLEDRSVPATFGVPWGDARHLTLSFVPDGTAIAGHSSTLFQTLDSLQATSTWERAVLRAFQTWAVEANINIGLRADGGQAIGAAGKSQHDPRFGDVRIAAHPMAPDALAISVPGGSLMAGSWAGDLFLNSLAFSGPGAPDLFGVALHEAGHVFGQDNSVDPLSPMYSHLSGATSPTAADIESLQRLFGARAPDDFEGSHGNESIATAVRFPIPSSYDSTRPLVLFADRTSSTDADVFAVEPSSNYTGPMTVRLQSAGLSLLSPHLTVTDAKGTVLGEAEAESGFGDTVTVRLPKVSPGGKYYLRIDSKARDVFQIGAYGLAVTFDAASTVDPAVLDRVLAGDFGTPGTNEVDAILRGAARGFLNDDLHSDDNAVTAVRPGTTPGFAPNSHYEAVGSISDATDVDFYRVRSLKVIPGQTGVMTVTIRLLDDGGIAPSASILDGELMSPVPTRVLSNGNGTYTIEAVGISSDSWYYVRVSGNDPAGTVTGNYELVVDSPSKPADLATFASGTIAAVSSPQTYDLYVASSQLFHLLLTAGTTVTPGTAVNMLVLDAGGGLRYTLTAKAGRTVSSEALFLTPGAYTIRFVSEGTDQPISYDLSGQSISDPVGPALADPTLTPIYRPTGTPTLPPIYAYPGEVISSKPFILVAVPTTSKPIAPPAPTTQPTPVSTTAPTGPSTPTAPVPPVSATPSVVGIAAVSRTKKGLGSISVAFDKAIDPTSAGKVSQYKVLGGIKKHGKTVYNKALRIRSVRYDLDTHAVTLSLVRPYKGALQVTVRGGIMAAGAGTGGGAVTSATILEMS